MRRNRFAPSPTYGKPHPGIIDAKADAVFIQSIFDAAPPHVRQRVHEKDAQPLFDWFYGLSCDPRPANNRPPVGPSYELPPFPWEDVHHAFMALFR